MLKKSLKLVATVLLVYTVLYITDLDDRLHYLTRSLANSAQQKNSSIWLDDYRQIGAPRILTGVNNNLSGISYCAPRQKLYAITNGPTTILELSKQGDVLRQIELAGFHDTEAIAYLYDDLFAVLEERKQALHIIRIDEQTRLIDRNEAITSLKLNLKPSNNLGFEGLAYDQKLGDFYIVNEKKPQQIIQVSGWNKVSPLLNIELAAHLIEHDIYLDDYSGLHFDQQTRHLLFLSHESKQLNEVSLQGEQISFMDLEQGFSGLEHDIPQAEGVTLDDEGTLYLVSEPNLFYRFKK